MNATKIELQIEDALRFLYGPDRAALLTQQLLALVRHYQGKDAADRTAVPARRRTLAIDQRDVMLITYGDQVIENGRPPLMTLKHVLDAYFRSAINSVHLLPHFPYSSDDGFSVIDYTAVDPELGTWENIVDLTREYKLMFDAVINHISSKSAWFQGYLKDDERYDDYFIEADPKSDLTQVFRPRALPLLTTFSKGGTEKYLWTTFSADQIDLNFSNPKVLLEVVDVLLTYVKNGASLLRLDAIGFLWKEVGTRCFHLPQTHMVVRLIRLVLDLVKPAVMLVPEINGTLDENLPYLGNGSNEAQMIYNFALAPLALDAFARGDASILSGWLKQLPPASSTTTLFNFLASHDGISVRAAAGILDDSQIDRLVERTEGCGGIVNFRLDDAGNKKPYELATTLYDVINCGTEESTHLARFRCIHAMMLSLAGMPGIYFHSFLGTENWKAGYDKTRHARTLNRKKFSLQEFEALFDDPSSRAANVHDAMTALLKARTSEPAFSPAAPQFILDSRPEVVAIKRSRLDQSGCVYAIHNISDKPVIHAFATPVSGLDLLTAQPIGSVQEFPLEPYAVLWMFVSEGHGTENR
ncbi:MAG: sugar phosphorylase [Myxococcales bacterium]|nr:sugar phosphorylase [Myxococcales bacterium]